MSTGSRPAVAIQSAMSNPATASRVPVLVAMSKDRPWPPPVQ